MLLNIPGGPDDLARAVQYLSQTPDVSIQVEMEYPMQQAEKAGGNAAEGKEADER